MKRGFLPDHRDADHQWIKFVLSESYFPGDIAAIAMKEEKTGS
jgi:hypothetical protein